MPAPGILVGTNETALVRFGAFNAVQGAPVTFWRNPGQAATRDRLSNIGVFGTHPGATPKYALNRSNLKTSRDNEYRETMSRLYVDVPSNFRIGDKTGKNAFINSVSREARPLARVLAKAASTGASTNTGFFDFLLTNAQENFQEKVQIADTLTDNYVAYYSGQEPPLFTYSGTLLNTYQDDQRVWMLQMYREILRGSRLANRNMTVKLRYDSFLVTGYMESLALGLDGSLANGSSFTFTIRVKQMKVITSLLSAPTVSEVGPTANSTLGNTNQTANDIDQRGATVSEDKPSSANTLPAATVSDISPARQRQVNARLAAAGKTADEIAAANAARQAARRTPEVDPREEAAAIYTENLSKQTDGSNGNLPNGPDAQSGATLVYGNTSRITVPNFAVSGGAADEAAVDAILLEEKRKKPTPRAFRRTRGRDAA